MNLLDFRMLMRDPVWPSSSPRSEGPPIGVITNVICVRSKALLLFFLVLICVFLCGCIGKEVEWSKVVNNKNNIHKGLSREEVIEILGKPNTINTLKKHDPRAKLGDVIMEYVRDDYVGLGFTSYEVYLSDGVVSATNFYSD